MDIMIRKRVLWMSLKWDFVKFKGGESGEKSTEIRSNLKYMVRMRFFQILYFVSAARKPVIISQRMRRCGESWKAFSGSQPSYGSSMLSE